MQILDLMKILYALKSVYSETEAIQLYKKMLRNLKKIII